MSDGDWSDLDASIAFDAAWEDDDPDLQFQCDNCDHEGIEPWLGAVPAATSRAAGQPTTTDVH